MTKTTPHSFGRNSLLVSSRPSLLVPVKSGAKGLDSLLFNLLTKATPRHSEKLLYPLLPGGKRTIDTAGNVIYNIGKNKQHKTMFSSHLDTIHRTPFDVGLLVDQKGMVYGINKETKAPSILGADDKLGVWIMCKLIEAKVPGLYIFHVGEEHGGVGSNHIVKNTPDVVKHIQRCIAFDRRDYFSVITSQRGGVCCSNKFAQALCDQLNTLKGSLKQNKGTLIKLDIGGIFTDSANYISLIQECTNISVGYFSEHSPMEHFNMHWLQKTLLPILLKIKWQELPTVKNVTPARSGWFRGTAISYSDSAAAWRNVTENTPPWNIPTWAPGDMLIDNVEPFALSCAIWKYIMEKGVVKASAQLAEQFLVADFMYAELQASYEELKELVEDEQYFSSEDTTELEEELQAAKKEIKILTGILNAKNKRAN